MQGKIHELENQLKEEKAKLKANITEAEKKKSDQESVQSLLDTLKSKDECLQKSEKSCNSARKAIEKQAKEKEELKSIIQNTSTQLETAEKQLQEKEGAIDKLKIDLVSIQKELGEAKQAQEASPENNASLNALKSLFEEKETECTKTKNELDVERKRNAELVVAIRVLKEVNGMPTTPSPTSSPSPSLITPPPPPLRPQQSTASQNVPSNAPLCSGGQEVTNNLHLGSAQNLRKRASPTPPPLMVVSGAPKVQRVIHLSENTATASSILPPAVGSQRSCHPSVSATSTEASVDSKTSQKQQKPAQVSSQDSSHTTSPPTRLNSVSSASASVSPVKSSAPAAHQQTGSIAATNKVNNGVCSSVTRPATSSTPGKCVG